MTWQDADVAAGDRCVGTGAGDRGGDDGLLGRWVGLRPPTIRTAPTGALQEDKPNDHRGVEGARGR